MTSDETTLAEAITTRRRELKLSASAAARLAGVHRLTWRAWEQGTSVPEDYNYARIEEALQWKAGSVDAKLRRAGEPEPVDAEDWEPRDAFERRVAATILPEKEKREWILAHRQALDERSNVLPPEHEKHTNRAARRNDSRTKG